MFLKAQGSEKIKVSEYLIRFQDIEALKFYTNWIKDQEELPEHMLENSPLRFLKSSEAIPILLDLLKICYEKNIKSSDSIYYFYRIILDGLTSIALESDRNYEKVVLHSFPWVYLYIVVNFTPVL